MRLPDGVVTAKAWGYSRPNETVVLIDDVIKVDTPVNELEDFILEVRCPIIIREMFFTQRDHVAWARTSRVDNLDDWPVHYLWADDLMIVKAYALMQERRKTETQDHFRLELPLCYMTGFTIKLSARTVMRFVAALHHLARQHRAGGLVQMMLDEMAAALWSVVQLTPYGSLKPDAYGKLDLLPYYTVPSGDVAVGHFVVIDFEDIPIALRAQIIRHRPIMYRDTLLNYVIDHAMCEPLTSPVYGQIMMTRETALAMVRKRNCWIAQEDLWSPIIQKINALFEKEQNVGVPLPCDSTCGECPFGRDNMLRQEKKDPAPPCPIWLGVNHIVPTFEQRIEIVDYMQQRPLTYHFWEQTYIKYIPDQGA
jgi:hypothetical protein